MIKSVPEALPVRDEGFCKVNGLPVNIQFVPSSAWESRWIDLHYHLEYIEILYAAKGVFSVMINGDVTEMEEGSIVIIHPGESHATRDCQPDNPDAALMCLKFMPELLYSVTPNANELQFSVSQIFDNFGENMHYFSPAMVKETCIPSEFNLVKQEYDVQSFGFDLAVRSCAIRIFVTILRCWYNHSNTDRTIPFNNTAFQMVQKVKEYIEENYQTANLKDAADFCNLSYSYLSHMFHQYTNTSFNNYVNLVRINHSIQALTDSNQSITDIAMASGFSSTSHYIQTFKKFKSISPNQFRKMFHAE